ncbi:TniQ family protein [Mycolicibacterium frederiksbergense]|uniref:TniQ domain-containing protein n=1 Tax=Mycolicibacterium frederiksbergense TaxID=117567 RepID=A0A6H0S3K5_9MYCO|nr:TniQ family protein [Mycolicibacterium frederiksbergense]QIV81750.1 hypothetical protein EXE63_13290 [Mycolicibacterium frederiksbergense]
MTPTELRALRTAGGGQSPPLRTLPLRTMPVPGEALDSWLQALAHHSDATWGDIGTATGYLAGRATGARQPITTITAAQMTALAYTTGITPQTLWAMTPASQLPVPYAMAAIRTLLMPGSRFCPRCLRDNGGLWPLWWRLRWAFACPTHHCLLTDCCPSCRRRQRIEAPPMNLVPQPGRCDRPALGGRRRSTPPRCGALLSDAITADAPVDSAVLSAQRRILNVIAAGVASGGIYGDGSVSALTYVTDLRVLGEQLLQHATCSPSSPGNLNAAPTWALNRDSTCADTTALGASLAVPILDCDSPDQAAQLLRTVLVPQAHHAVARHLRTHMVSGALTPAGLGLECAGGPVQQLRAVISSQSAGRCSSDRYHGVPALVWPAVAYRFALPGLGFERLRHALSVALILVGSPISLEETCARLGNPYPPRSVTRALQHLHAHPGWSYCLATLSRLADDIDRTPPPIDYARRRQLSYQELLPDAAWRDISWQQGVLAGRGVKVQLHRCWLFERLTGSPARHCLHAINSPKFASALAVLPRELPPDVVATLVEVGRMFLDDQGLHREPVSWQPSLPAAVGGPVHWSAASIARLHRMIVTEGRSMTVAAGALNTTAGVIRSVLGDHPPPRDSVGWDARVPTALPRCSARAAHSPATCSKNSTKPRD